MRQSATQAGLPQAARATHQRKSDLLRTDENNAPQPRGHVSRQLRSAGDRPGPMQERPPSRRAVPDNISEESTPLHSAQSGCNGNATAGLRLAEESMRAFGYGFPGDSHLLPPLGDILSSSDSLYMAPFLVDSSTAGEQGSPVVCISCDSSEIASVIADDGNQTRTKTKTVLETDTSTETEGETETEAHSHQHLRSHLQYPPSANASPAAPLVSDSASESELSCSVFVQIEALAVSDAPPVARRVDPPVSVATHHAHAKEPPKLDGKQQPILNAWPAPRDQSNTDKAGRCPVQKSDCIHAAKRALDLNGGEGPCVSVHRAPLVTGRQVEVSRIYDFWMGHLLQRRSGAMYVSGKPGTGKTLAINKVMGAVKLWITENQPHDNIVIYINCLRINSKTTETFYSDLIKTSNIPVIGKRPTQAESKYFFRELVNQKDGPMISLIADEMDGLSGNIQLLYELFDIASSKSSRLVLIGIANSLGFTEQVLPNLRKREILPELVQYSPYNKEAILGVLTERINFLPKDFIDPCALELCAGKVASLHGDMRIALDLCRAAIELVERDFKSRPEKEGIVDVNTYENTKDGGYYTIGMQHMRRVLMEFMPSNNESPISGLTTHQKLVLCAATKLMLGKKGKRSSVNLAQLKKGYHTLYSTFLTVSDIDEQMSFNEIWQMIPMLKVSGKAGTDANHRTVSLACPADDMAQHFRSEVLFADMLESSVDLLK